MVCREFGEEEEVADSAYLCIDGCLIWMIDCDAGVDRVYCLWNNKTGVWVLCLEMDEL